MRKSLIVAAALMLAGCVTDGNVATSVGGDYPLRDSHNFPYPEQCKGPISHDGDVYKLNGKQMLVYFVPHSSLPRGYMGTQGPAGALVASDLSGWLRDDVVRHELCHAIAGAWHVGSEIGTK